MVVVESSVLKVLCVVVILQIRRLAPLLVAWSLSVQSGVALLFGECKPEKQYCCSTPSSSAAPYSLPRA